MFKFGDDDLLIKLSSLYDLDPDLQDIKIAKKILVYDKQFIDDDFSNYIYDVLLGYLLN